MSQLRHHLLHPLLPDIGVNLRRGDALVAEQGLDVHQFGPGVEPVSYTHLDVYKRQGH